MKRLYTLLSLFVSIVSFAQTQNPVLEWEKTYGGSSHDGIDVIISTTEGGYLLGGYSKSDDGDIQSENNGKYDFWVVKINGTGILEWEKTYGGSSNEYLKTMLSTADGGYILGGTTSSDDGDILSEGHDKSDYWVVKIDSAGSIEWEKTYGSSIYYEYLESMIPTPDGGYLLGGYASSLMNSNNYWLIKIDSTGTIEWEKTYGGSASDALYAMLSTTDGGYLLGGYTGSVDDDIQSGNKGEHDFWVVKTDSLGNIEWEKTYGGSENEYLFSMLPVSDGGYLLGGDTYSNDGDVQSDTEGNIKNWVVKIDNSGSIEWKKTYGGSNNNFSQSMVPTTDGGYLLGGYESLPDFGDRSIWLNKINSTGTVEWETFYGGSEDDELYSVIPTSNNGYLLGGSSTSIDGDIQSGNQGKKDFWVLKINVDNTTGIETLNYDVKIFPNPTLDYFTIKTPFNHPVQLNIVDIYGKSILTQSLSQNTNHVSLNHFPAGVYFVLLTDNENIVHQQQIIKQ